MHNRWRWNLRRKDPTRANLILQDNGARTSSLCASSYRTPSHITSYLDPSQETKDCHDSSGGPGYLQDEVHCVAARILSVICGSTGSIFEIRYILRVFYASHSRMEDTHRWSVLDHYLGTLFMRLADNVRTLGFVYAYRVSISSLRIAHNLQLMRSSMYFLPIFANCVSR